MALTEEQRREAAWLLAELLVDAARGREGVLSGGGFDGVLGGASGGVDALPNERSNARRSA